MNIIFRPHFFGGKNNNFDEVFVPLCLKNVLKYNPNSNIYFISNYDNIIERFFKDEKDIDYSKLKCFTFDIFESDETREFSMNYIHLSKSPLLFEKFCILSYFYTYNLMKHLTIEEAIVVETDVLVFCDLTEKFRNYFDLVNTHAILAKMKVLACSYIKIIYLETFIKSILKIYSDNDIIQSMKDIFTNTKMGITDMTINGWIYHNHYKFNNYNNNKVPILIKELCIILDDNSFFDNQLAKTLPNCAGTELDNNFEFKKSDVGLFIKKIYYIDNEPYFKYKENLIKCNCIHFGGNSKILIPEVYKLSNKI